MYVPRHFREERPHVLQQLIRDNPFGTLVTVGGGGIEASHIPFLFDAGRGPQGTLRAHIARANQQWRSFDDGEALAIFQGPHGYISPSWYGAGPAVPTWNYSAVHAYGPVRVIDSGPDTLALLADMVAAFELGRADAWTLDTQSERFLRLRASEVVAFEIEVTRLEGKAKLSQNRPNDVAGVVAALASDPATQALATGMQQYTPDER
jgi:transcriptional regulator